MLARASTKLDLTKRDNLNCTYSAFASVDAYHASNHYDRLHCFDESSFAGVGGAAAVVVVAFQDDAIDDPVGSI